MCCFCFANRIQIPPEIRGGLHVLLSVLQIVYKSPPLKLGGVLHVLLSVLQVVYKSPPEIRGGICITHVKKFRPVSGGGRPFLSRDVAHGSAQAKHIMCSCNYFISMDYIVKMTGQ